MSVTPAISHLSELRGLVFKETGVELGSRGSSSLSEAGRKSTALQGVLGSRFYLDTCKSRPDLVLMLGRELLEICRQVERALRSEGVKPLPAEGTDGIESLHLVISDLQRMNAELRSSNAELHAANEELEAVNLVLTEVNERLLRLLPEKVDDGARRQVNGGNSPMQR